MEYPKPGERQMLPRCHICAVRVDAGRSLCGKCEGFARAADVLARRLQRYTERDAVAVAEGLLRCVNSMPLPYLKHVVVVRERLEGGLVDGQGSDDGVGVVGQGD